MDAEAFVGFRQVPAARYGGLMATTAALPRRIHAFVRWVVRTPWPLFSLSMLQSDIIGALFVLGFLRYGLPPQDNIQLQDLPPVNLLIFVSTVIILFLAGAVVNLKLLMPALRSGVPENVNAPGVILRLMLAWIPSTGVPLLAIVLAVAADKIALLHATPEALFNPILMMALAALGIGSVSTLLVAMSIADPLRQLRWALSEVQRGNYNAHMQIYDASELGLLQAGFNDMVRELSERQRLRDLFGRYVGEDVARRALERGTELGGQERDVAVLFVDLVGSTQLAATRPPAEVVQLLNEFFRVVVETVARHGGFVNKFQGDAALAIFGAPIEHPDGAGAALSAARELHDELIPVLGSAEFGIGVSAGRAIAGHIGAQARFEYTVIGDPVNEAARLTELAKLEDGHVLASAIAVSGALDAEALCWDVGEVVELRGRAAPTQLARPMNLAAPEEVSSEVRG